MAVRDYTSLTKPGIIKGNLVAAVAGFFLAVSNSDTIDWLMLPLMLVGLALVIASGCVFNNYIDRDIDKLMKRTKKRSLVTGAVQPRNALLFGSALGIAGFILLYFMVNALTAWVALFGFFAYVVVYGYFKRQTPLGTAVGSISGAIPPVVGYTAVTNQLTLAAVLLFIILVTWQMAHFYAISLLRSKEYAAAHIPVLPLVVGNRQTKIQILFFIGAFVLAMLGLSIAGYASLLYMVVAIGIGVAWLYVGVRQLSKSSDTSWGGKMFGYSLVALLVWCISIVLDGILSQVL